jgi:preprotein translocase subunit SecF
VELFRDTNIDFLSKKWYFLAFSLIFSLAGLASMAVRHHSTRSFIPLGIDFRGGTVVDVKFSQKPNGDAIRADLDRAGLKNATIQTLTGTNEVLIRLDIRETSEQALDQGKESIIKALQSAAEPGKTDLNNIGSSSLQDYLLKTDPLHLGTDAPTQYGQIARAIVDFRDKTRGGVLNSVSDVSAVAPAPVVQVLQQDFITSNFGVRNVDIVGPQVGAQLRKQAVLATLYSLAGMLVYLWFRFELIYGIAAVVACFHDTLITVGAFSLLNTEISLTVIAAILTLVGYSMNDTIVVFDRIRENIKLLRKDTLTEIVNKSINQTLSRTVLTSGLTFLTVLALFLFGGEVLHGFSLALVIGIIIGTYSSIFIAAPMLVAYQQWRGNKSVPGGAASSSSSSQGRRYKAPAKA